MIHWQPGEEGKGIVDQNDVVHAWNDEDYELHQDFLDHHQHLNPSAYFYVRPEGEIEMTHPHPAYDHPSQVEAMHDIICQADPHFHVAEPDRWSF